MDERKSKIAILGASYMAELFIKKAKEIEIKTYCFSWEEGAVAKKSADVFYPISVMEKEKILDICKQVGIDGVVATTEAPLATCSYIATNMKLNGNSLEIGRNITDKNWVREKAKKCVTLKQPSFICFDKMNKISATMWNRYPAIIKPRRGGGKRGVIVINKSEDLSEAIDYAISFDRNKNGILIEEYIENGKEYSVESLSYNGKHRVIQITEKISSGPPHCVELGHHQPALLQPELRKKVCKSVCELLDSVGFNNGPTHTEIKIISDDIYLIELNARPGGDHIASTLTMLSTGYDYIGESIRVALNLRPREVDNAKSRYTGVYFLTKQTSFLKPIFDTCDNENWLYEKHVESEELLDLTHNDCMHTNYIIYCSDKRIELYDTVNNSQ